MATVEYTAVRVPRATHDRLLAMQKTILERAQAGSPFRLTISLGHVLEAALDALETTVKGGL